MPDAARSGSLWRSADFLKLWGGQSISELGSQISQLAIPLIAIFALNATPFQVGLLSAVEFSPFLLVGLPAGAIVDRLPRRLVLVVCDLGRALLLATVPLAALLDALTLPQLYVVGFLTGILTVFFDVAYQSYLPALVSRDQLADGNAKLTVSSSGAALAGPGVSGWLVGAVGGAFAVALDALSFIASGLAVLAIRGRESIRRRADDGAPRPTIRRDVAEGLRFVLGHPLLRKIAGCTGTANLGTSISGAVLTLYMARRLDLSPALIGVVFSVGSVGFLLGALVSNRVTARFKLGPVILASSFVSGLGPLLWPLAAGPLAIPLLLAGELLLGVGIPAYNINQVSLRQAITPDRLQGRMNASMRFIVWGTMPVGSLIGGALGGLVGLRPTLVVGALVSFSAFLWILFSPVKNLAGIPEPVEELPLGAAAESAVPLAAAPPEH